MSQGIGRAGSVDVRALIDEGRFSGLQRATFALCFAIVLLDGFDTAAIGYIAPSLITEWGVSRPALAPVLSAALFGLAFGALSAGPLADRFGRKAMLIASVLELGLACLAFVKVFGWRPEREGAGAAAGPAFENLQGRKPRGRSDAGR